MDIQPQTKAEQALDQIQKIRIFDLPDELTLARFKKTAEDSLKIDPVSAHLILGTIAAHQWNYDGIVQHFTDAYELSRDASALVNKSLALQSIEKVAESALVIEKASDLEPTNLEYLRMAITSAAAAGRYEKASTSVRPMTKRRFERSPEH
jgi:tetratricopeptide (TPR) repeat protein